MRKGLFASTADGSSDFSELKKKKKAQQDALAAQSLVNVKGSTNKTSSELNSSLTSNNAQKPNKIPSGTDDITVEFTAPATGYVFQCTGFDLFGNFLSVISSQLKSPYNTVQYSPETIMDGNKYVQSIRFILSPSNPMKHIVLSIDFNEFVKDLNKISVDENSPISLSLISNNTKQPIFSTQDLTLKILYDALKLPISQTLGKLNLFYIYFDAPDDHWFYQNISQYQPSAEEQMPPPLRASNSASNSPLASKVSTPTPISKVSVKDMKSITKGSSLSFANLTNVRTIQKELNFAKVPKTLSVKLLKGVDLAICDMNGFSDPFVVITLGDRQKQKSEIIYKSLNPQWNQEFQFELSYELSSTKEVKFEVLDWDFGKSPDFMGQTSISLQHILIKQKMKLPLKGRLGMEKKDSHVKGHIEVIFDVDSKEPVKERDSQIFGVELTTIMLRRNEVELIPRQVKDMMDYILKYGLEITGIFRISGGNEFKDRWIKLLDQGESAQIMIMNPKATDDTCHNMSSIFKHWLRSLPTPLLTFDLFDEFVKVPTLDSKDEKLVRYAELIGKLPNSHRNMLNALIDMSQKVANKKDINMMPPENVAVVFALNILTPKDEMKAQMMIQSIVKVYTELVVFYPQYFEVLKKMEDGDEQLQI